MKSARPLSLISYTAFLLLLLSAPLCPQAHAEDAATDAPKDPTTLTGNWGGLRDYLSDHGLDINAQEFLDVFSNPTGGSSRGTITESVFEPTADFDMSKMTGIEGLTAHASAFMIAGRGLSASDLNNNIATSTGIEAERGTRLFELWAQKSLLNDNLSVRLGQIAADQEFALSQYGSLFINAAYGWPSSIASNLPGGGPGYPLASPGIRVKYGQNDPVSFMAAIFDGDPSGGPGNGSAQHRNPSGTRFPIKNDPLVMTEVTYQRKGGNISLPGTYKAGLWYHAGKFADQRYGTDGLSLADPASNGIAKSHDGDYGFYGIVDQMLWHKADDADKGVAGFTRFFWYPDNQNLIAYQWDAGLNFIGLIPGRENDLVGVAFSYLPFTNSVTAFDEDTNRLNGTNSPVRKYEKQIELTYQAPINYWFTLQPDFQYIFRPGGGVANPNDASGKPVGDAAIFGVRGLIKL